MLIRIIDRMNKLYEKWTLLNYLFFFSKRPHFPLDYDPREAVELFPLLHAKRGEPIGGRQRVTTRVPTS